MRRGLKRSLPIIIPPCTVNGRRRLPDEKGIETDLFASRLRAGNSRGGAASPMRRGLKQVLLLLCRFLRFPGGAASPMRRGLKRRTTQPLDYGPPPGRRRLPDEKGIETVIH